MNKEELKELLAHAIVDMHFTEGHVSRVKSELVNKVVDVVDKWYQEPVKPVLPKNVADELEDIKMRGASFAGYVSWFLEGSGTTYNWLVGRGVLTDDYVLVLSNAWYNGYTVEKEPRYVVYVPGTNNKFLYNKRGDSSTRAAKLETPIVPSPVTSYQTAYSQYKPLYWFTDEEINRFNLQDCEKELVTDDSEDY